MTKVQAYIYDITQGFAKQMSMALLGKQVDYIPHTGVVVFGKEYFFGSGPCIGEPGKTVPCQPHHILELGETSKSCEELEAYISSTLASQYTPEQYNLCTHNCNHYADAVAKFLLGDDKGLPHEVVNIADVALSTPQGQNIRAMIENMESSMRNQMGGTSAFNPYGNVGAAPGGFSMPPAMATPAAPAAPAAAPAGGEVNEELEGALTDIRNSNSEEVRRTALSTLLKITENVEKNPHEPKFRKIKANNAVFSKKIQVCHGAVEAMLAAGWMPDTTPEGEDVWQVTDEAASHQALPRRRFTEELALLPPAPEASRPATPAAPAPSPASAPAFGGMGGTPGGFPGGMPGGFPGGMPGGADPAMMQQMMSNPAMMSQAQQMMNNPQMMAQAQQMMQDPQMMAQVQQMMQNPQMMAQMQQMMGGMGR